MENVSAREHEVLDLVGAGLTNAQIGARLFISVRTVESHVSALLRKLELADRKELARRAVDTSGDTSAPLSRAPEAFTSFVGRRTDLDEVARALGSDRLVTLTGPGGIGKTRLAIEAGRRHPAAAKWFVDLVPAQGDQIAQAIASTLDAAEGPGRTVEQAVVQTLDGRNALVVLDNCEHVLDEAASVSRRLLQQCPGLRILATSREALAVPGERIVPLQPLAIDDDDGAVTLFTARARAAGSHLDDIDRALVAAICTRLEGIPLAIEIAAARCATLGVDGVSGALGDRLRLLSGARGADERHRSLRAVLDWSYDLLSEEERFVLCRLAAFHGVFGLDDAAALTRDGIDPADTADVVGRLAGKSLVVHARDERGVSRYRLLETVREYGLARLVETHALDTSLALHLEWALDLSGELEQTLPLRGDSGTTWDVALDDLRGALTWAAESGRRQEAHVLARRIARISYARRFVSEAQARYRQAAEFAADDVEAARDLIDAGYAAFAFLRGDIGYECFMQAGELAERAGDHGVAAHALALACEKANRFPAEFREAPDHATLTTLFGRVEELAARSAGDARDVAQIANAEAWLGIMSGDDAAAEAAVNAAVELTRASADPVLESSALDALSGVVWAKGRLAESAQISLDRTSLLARMPSFEPRADGEQLDILHMASDVSLARGDLPRALSFSLDAVENPLSAGAQYVLHRELVVGLCLTGRFDEALDEAGVMRRAWENSGRPVAGWMAPATYLVALVHGLRGEREEFRDWTEIAERVCLAPDNAMRAFSTLRLALHDGRLDDGRAEIERYRSVQGTLDSAFPWAASSIGYEGYFWAAAADFWAADGDGEAFERVEQVEEAFRDHLWAQACLQRARGRLVGDESTLRAAAGAFAALGARFEEASTLILLGGDDENRARAMFDEMGSSVPRI